MLLTYLTYLTQAVCDLEGGQPRWRPVHCTSPGWSLRFSQTWELRRAIFGSGGLRSRYPPTNEWKWQNPRGIIERIKVLCSNSSSMRLIIAIENSIYYRVVSMVDVSMYDCRLYLVSRRLLLTHAATYLRFAGCVSGEQNGGGADSLGANSAKPGRHHTTIGGK